MSRKKCFHSIFFCGALGWAAKDQPMFELRPDLVQRWLWGQAARISGSGSGAKGGVGTRGACSAHPAPLAGEWPRLQGCVSPASSSLVAQALGGLV